MVILAANMGQVMWGKKKNFMTGALWILVLSHCIGCSNGQSGTTKPKDTIPLIAAASQAPVDKFAWQPLVQDSTKQYIYLSFDDGPQPGTMICYDILKQANVKASFFMVGLHAARKSDGKKIVALIRESYPQILLANHSYTHANDKYYYFYQHPEMAEQDFYKAQDSLHVPYKIARLPGNSAWSRQNEIKASNLVRPVTTLLDSAGYNVIGWDVEWRFNHKNARPVQSPEKLIAEVDSAFARNHTHVKNQLVILSHDRMFQRPGDADSLAKFINLLKQNPNYILETVDHYPGLKKPRQF
jgi:peptidoglycan/xylan/chitin deacetylase (PgdA/CDA1 family)